MSGMFTVLNLKRVLAAIIAICFFLPLCQCSAKQAPMDPQAQQPAQQLPPVFVPAKAIEFQSWDELALVAIFFWPLGVTLVRLPVRGRKRLAVVAVVEVALSAVSLGYLVQVVGLWGQIRYGGVLAIGSYATYMFVSTYGLIPAGMGHAPVLPNQPS